MTLYPLMKWAGTDDCPSLQQGKRYMTMTSQSGLTGLQQLRELAASGRKIEIGETLGFRLAEVEEGRAVFESKPGRHLYSPIGRHLVQYHGGALRHVAGPLWPGPAAPEPRRPHPPP